MPASKTMKLIDAIEQHVKLPALRFRCTTDQKGKKVPQDLPKGWLDLHYEETVEMNKTRKGNGLAINLTHGDFMVVDVDSPDAVAKCKELYQTCWETKSLSRNLPHMWFQTHPEDARKNRINPNGDNVDFIYEQIWEDPDQIVDWDAHTVPEVFGDFVKKEQMSKTEHMLTKCSKPVPCSDTNQTPTLFQRRILDNIALKYWRQRSTWVSLVFGMKNEGLSEDVINEYSKKGGSSYDEGCVEKLLASYNPTYPNPVTWGTVEKLSKESNCEEHIAIKVNQPKSVCEATVNSVTLELDDRSLAESFLAIEKDNVVFSAKKIVLFRDGEWSTDVKGNYCLKNFISNTLVKEVLTAQQVHNAKMQEAATPEERKRLEYRKSILDKIYQRVCSSSGIDKIGSFAKGIIISTKKDIVFDLNKEQMYNLHFRNGVLDLKTKKFRKRVQLDYVTQYLDWDYDPNVDETKLAWVKEMYRKIQPDEGQRTFMFQYLGYCLTGDISKTMFKMNIGYSGGNGKSTEFKTHAEVFPIYSHKVGKDTFQLNNAKRHKSMHHVLVNPIRFLYVEELSEKKLDVDYLKDLVDGSQVECEVMYGTAVTSTVQCKLNTCSNKDFSGSVDGGILRRGKVQYYTSSFRQLGEIHLGQAVTEKWFNDDRHQYKTDLSAPARFYDDGYKNAYLKLLLDHFDLNFEAPAVNTDAFKQILNENDDLQHMLDEFYVKTGEDSDRVDRDDLMDQHFGSKRHCGKVQFNSMMRARGYTWSKSLRVPGHGKSRGCFVGLRPRLPDDSDEE